MKGKQPTKRALNLGAVIVAGTAVLGAGQSAASASVIGPNAQGSHHAGQRPAAHAAGDGHPVAAHHHSSHHGPSHGAANHAHGRANHGGGANKPGSVPGAHRNGTKALGTRHHARAFTAYWVVNRNGAVGAGGGAPNLGSLPTSMRLAQPIIGMAATSDGKGYWLASADGGVFTFGDAKFYGSVNHTAPHGSRAIARATGTVAGIAAAPDGHGYWLATAQGAVYSFGDARYFGGAGPRQLGRSRGGHAERIVGIFAAPGGEGYWLVTADGGVYSFGGARFRGSAAGRGRDVVGFAPTDDGRGYWLVTAKGDLLPYGDARVVGSPEGAASKFVGAGFVGIAAQRDGIGYWLASSRGTAFGYGAARHSSARDLARGTVAIAADPAPVIPGQPRPAPPGARIAAKARKVHVDSRRASLSTGDPGGEAAVKFALSQVGKPYVWGGTGPYGYDCSGLALASWHAAGINLPRTAAEQYYAGTHIALSDVRPGDLIFWASDPSDPATIYHVAISLGGAQTVQATQPGEDVHVIGLWGGGLVPVATRP